MPDASASIGKRLNDLKRKNGKIIAKVEQELSDLLSAQGIEASVEGRQKQPYSVWRKMERKSVAFEHCPIFFGFRVYVNTVEECYRAVGVIHTKWPAVPGRFKDYISTPKENDYRSIHTTVVGPGRQRVELQVRTHDMHEIARYGIAAHALYKDGGVDDREVLAHESRAYQWLQRTIDMLAEGDSPEEFLEHTKLELFQRSGLLLHAERTDHRAAARGDADRFRLRGSHEDRQFLRRRKINGRAAPLAAPLVNGDEVEIIRAEGQVPPPVWESLVIDRQGARRYPAAPRAMPCAPNIRGSGGRSWCGPSSAPASPSPKTS